MLDSCRFENYSRETVLQYTSKYSMSGDVAKLRLFEHLHAALWAFRKIIICSLFFSRIANCRNIV